MFFLFVFVIAFAGGWFSRAMLLPEEGMESNAQPTDVPRPLDVYTIDNLKSANITPGLITIDRKLEEEDEFTSYVFSFEFDPNFDGTDLKTTTGMINVPNEPGEYPLVVMFRGYVDETIYQTGIGTRNAGRYFAERGYITIAPDFLGYAGSDRNAADIFESRFQTYTTALSLLETVSGTNTVSLDENVARWDNNNIFIWAHSNGGQITLTALEAGGYDYPTTMWAPVTRPFPYTILYYTDESEDRGKFIRSELAKFEELYDADLYSIEEYYSDINAPLQVHQGTDDDAVPQAWNDSFVQRMKNLEKDVTYYIYPATDHNMRPFWNRVVERDLEFFESFRDDEDVE